MLRWIRFLIILLIIGNGTCVLAQEVPKALLGGWTATDGGVVGVVHFTDFGSAMFVIGGDTLGGPNFTIKGEPAELRYKVDTSAVPNTIDFSMVRISDFAEAGVLPGIWHIESGTLVLCLNFEGDDRPESLADEQCLQLKRTRGK